MNAFGYVHAFVLLLLFLEVHGFVVLIVLRTKRCRNRYCYETETIKDHGLIVVHFSGRFRKSIATDPITADGQGMKPVHWFILILARPWNQCSRIIEWPRVERRVKRCSGLCRTMASKKAWCQTLNRPSSCISSSSSSSKWTASTVPCAVVRVIVEEESNVDTTLDVKVERGDALRVTSLIGAAILDEVV